MPNWCDNTITITGDDDELVRLWEIIRPEGEVKHVHLTNAFPCPEELKNTVSGFLPENDPGYATWREQQESNRVKYGHADWYDWCVANWGTKWEPDFDLVDDDIGRMVLRGDSAWSPPIELVQEVSRRYRLTFRMVWSELGCDFVGAAVIRNGEVHTSSGAVSPAVHVDEDSDDFWNELEAVRERLEMAHLLAAEGIAEAHA